MPDVSLTGKLCREAPNCTPSAGFGGGVVLVRDTGGKPSGAIAVLQRKAMLAVSGTANSIPCSSGADRLWGSNGDSWIKVLAGKPSISALLSSRLFTRFSSAQSSNGRFPDLGALFSCSYWKRKHSNLFSVKGFIYPHKTLDKLYRKKISCSNYFQYEKPRWYNMSSRFIARDSRIPSFFSLMVRHIFIHIRFKNGEQMMTSHCNVLQF